MKSLRIVIYTICVLIVFSVGFLLTGLYNISARVPHFAPTLALLELVRDRSIAHHSKTMEAPPLNMNNIELARKGVIHFDETCRKCHGAPGKPREEFAEGLYPAPPHLEGEENELSPTEIFWVIKNGLKMTGMPAFGINHEIEEIAGMTVFIGKLPNLDAAGYQQFVDEARAVNAGGHHHMHEEESPTDTHENMEEEHDHTDTSGDHMETDENEGHHH